MYSLNKIVGWCLSPLGIVFLGLGVGLALARWTRFKRSGKTVAWCAVVFLWVMGCGITTRFIGVPLEGSERSVSGAPRPECDAIVLLGGGMGAHEKCGRAEMFSGADRVWEAARAWKELKIKNGDLKIYASGGGVETSTVPLLADLGVPREAIACLEDPRNTEEEARRIAEEGVKRIMLVTSAWHMPRAKMLFERAGFAVLEAPTDYEMHCAAEEPVRLRDFFPGAEPLVKNSYAMKEWVARALYRLKSVIRSAV